jgi:ABC-type phosphate/phosphonate transport system permease subunit
MIVLGFGSFLLCYVLYRARLVPRFLSVIGFVGYAGLLTSSCLAIAGHDAGAALYIPGAIFEIVLPLWLLIKGFNDRAEKS